MQASAGPRLQEASRKLLDSFPATECPSLYGAIDGCSLPLVKEASRKLLWALHDAGIAPSTFFNLRDGGSLRWVGEAEVRNRSEKRKAGEELRERIFGRSAKQAGVCEGDGFDPESPFIDIIRWSESVKKSLREEKESIIRFPSLESDFTAFSSELGLGFLGSSSAESVQSGRELSEENAGQVLPFLGERDFGTVGSSGKTEGELEGGEASLGNEDGRENENARRAEFEGFEDGGSDGLWALDDLFDDNVGF